MEAGVGCLFAFVFLVGELFLFSGQFREEMAGNEVASFCAFIALIFKDGKRQELAAYLLVRKI